MYSHIQELYERNARTSYQPGDVVSVACFRCPGKDNIPTSICVHGKARRCGYQIGGLDGGLRYFGIVGQYPGWHRWLMGNRVLMKILATLIPSLPDPLHRFMEVQRPVGQHKAYGHLGYINEDEIKRYDEEQKCTGRTEFLSQLRAEKAKDGKISQGDMTNPLSNSLYVF